MIKYSMVSPVRGVSHGHSRRGFLALAGAAASVIVVGCTVGRPRSAASPTRVADPLSALLTDHAALRDTYAATIMAIPTLGPRLTPLHANLEQHVAALAAALARKPPQPVASSSAATPAVAPATDPAAAITALHGSEASLQQAIESTIPSAAADRTGLLGSIAACHACHQAVLQ